MLFNSNLLKDRENVGDIVINILLHLDNLYYKIKKSEENTEKKNDSILKVAQSVYGIDMDEPTKNAWTHKYYQISNRLAFAHKMKELITPSTKFNDVVMVFINFVNDDTWKQQGLMVSDSNVWNEKYKVILKEMKLSKPLLDANNVIIINLDVELKHSNMRQDK